MLLFNTININYGNKFTIILSKRQQKLIKIPQDDLIQPNFAKI